MLTEPVRGATAAEGRDTTSAGWLVRRAAIAYIAIAIVLTGVAALAVNLPEAHETLSFNGSNVLGGWCRDDCNWYVDIADRGYYFLGTEQQSSVAFFPGYPLVARPLARAIDNTPVALMIVTWVAGLATLMLFAAWCARRLERRVALLAVACFALYPYGWFLYGVGYADALFLAFAIGAFLLLESDQPVLAGLAGAAAAATRPVGIAVAVGLLLRAIERRGGLPARGAGQSGTVAAKLGIPARLNVRVLKPRDLGVLLAPAGLIAWSVWLWTRFDDPFAYSTVQAAWDQAEGPHTWFKIGFGGQILHGVDTGYRAGILVQAIVTAVALVSVPFIARRFGASYGVYTLLAVGFAALATKDFQGMGRYLLGAFPVFALAGTLLAARPRIRAPVFAAAGTLLVFGAFGFAAQLVSHMRDAAATARRAYASESFGTRVHTALRWRTCPFREVSDELPQTGEILDVGCGHGLFCLYLAVQAAGRRITGVDIDDEKLTVARRAADAAHVDGRVAFDHVDSDWKPDPRWDAIVEVDMLYLLGRERAADWVHTAAAALEPGGRLVVKELDVTPSWKARWSRFQEILATRVLRITEGEELELIPRDDVVAAMRDANLDVTTRRLDRGRLHPHYVAVGTRQDP